MTPLPTGHTLIDSVGTRPVVAESKEKIVVSRPKASKFIVL